MLIVGAGGLAAQLFDDLVYQKAQDVVFWSEVETKYGFIKDKFPIISTDAEVIDYFDKVTKSFVLCVSSIDSRKLLLDRFKKMGGNISSFISSNSLLNAYITVGKGSVILSRVEIEACVSIGEECLINKTANIGHGCIIGRNCEIAPGVILTGEVQVGDNSYIGTRAVVLPKVIIGKNVVVTAGAIVKKNVPDNAVVAGEFATIKYYKK